MNKFRKIEIWNNGKMLTLEIHEFKTLWKAEVIDKSKYFTHVGTLRVRRNKNESIYKELRRTVRIFTEMCVKKNWF